MGGTFGGTFMREYIPIILAAALVMGMAGTLLAKTARKKSSYPLLYLSAALAVLTLFGVVFSAALIVLPSKVAAEETMPAVIYDSKTGELMKTSITLEGEWTYGNLAKRNKSYSGKIIIDCFDYTDSDCEIELSYFDDEDTVLSGIYKYVDSGECLLFTDEKGTWFYIDTVSTGFVIMAPAETAGEAKEISSFVNGKTEE